MNRVHTGLLGIVLFFTLAPTVSASTWYVNGISGNNADGCKSPTTACKTIGHAITLAASGDSIMVAPATYTENLTISISLSVIGSRAATTIVDGGGVSAVLTISGTAKVNLSGLTIRDGRAPNGGGIHNNGALTINNSIISGNKAAISCSTSFCATAGGGIYNNGALTINNTIMSGNEALIQCINQCGSESLGGGIFNNSGALAIANSTISGNSAAASCPPPRPPPFGREFCHTGGGGIFVGNGTVTISNSTISGNGANAAGGIDNRGTLTISNSTVSGNRASFLFNAVGGGVLNGGVLAINNSTISGNSAHGGGGIYGTATLQNSIVANNTGGNCYGTLKSNGHNLSSDGSCNFNHAGDLNNHDPLLGPLQNNGGPTETMALLPGSPAIDAGNPSGCTDGQGHLLKTDQRGMPRPDREDIVGCDMGAYERQSD